MAIGRPLNLTANVATKNISVLSTAGQTSFTVVGGYRINEIAVYRNGTRLVDGRDFTATDGSIVTLVSAATLGDVIEYQIFDSFNVANAIGTSGDATINGNLTAGIITGTTATFTGLRLQGSASQSSLETDGGSLLIKTLDGGGSFATRLTIADGTDGNATFTGNVISGAGDAYAGANNGVRLYDAGTVFASRTGGTNTVFEGYTTGISTSTSKINADGSATFAGPLTVYDALAVAATDLSFTIRNPGNTADVASIDGNGAATFAGIVTTSQYFEDSIGKLRSIPQNSKTSSYTAVSSDSGKHISITTGGVTIGAAVFSVGDAFSIYNNSGSTQLITQGAGVTLRYAGSSSTGNRNLLQYGICSVLCVSSNEFVISGTGLS